MSMARVKTAGLSPRVVLGGAVVLVVLLVALIITAVGALSAPDAPDPVTMAPAVVLAPAVQQPVRAGASRPVAPWHAPASRPTPKRSSVEDATGKAGQVGTGKAGAANDETGKAYENGMDMARHAAGGGPWSGFIP